MDGTGAELGQRGIVALGAVALVDREAVLGILPVQLLHPPVPGDLGQDGRRGDAGAQAVAADDGLDRHTQGRAAVAVHQGDIRLEAQGRHGPLHGEERGV